MEEQYWHLWNKLFFFFLILKYVYTKQLLGKHVAADSVLTTLGSLASYSSTYKIHICKIIYIYMDENITFRDREHYSLWG